MSHQDPGPDAQLDQDIAVPIPREPGGTRRYVATFAAAALAATAIGGGVWAWRSFMAQGAQPAEALPANTLAYAALDLDPPGGQKVAAYNALRKFPSIKRELGLNSVDDVQKSLVDQVTSDSGCDLSYETVKSWLGDRMAVAVVPQKNPEGVVVLQVDDEEGARTGLKKASTDCGFGFSVQGGWAVLARSETVAEQVSKDAGSGSLDDHGDFKRLTSAAGDPGLVTLYAAPEAGQALLDAMDSDPFTAFFVLQAANGVLNPVTSVFSGIGLLTVADPVFEGSASSSDTIEGPTLTPAQKKEQARLDAKMEHYDELSPAERKALDAEMEQFYNEVFGPHGEKLSGVTGDPSGGDPEFTDESSDEFPTPEIDPALRDSLKKFTGLGGIGRISDGALEVEIVGDQLGGTSAAMYAGDKGKDLVSDLPSNSAAAFGAGLADGWVDALFRQLANEFLFSDTTEDKTIKAFEKATGLDVPSDLEALGGDGVSVVAGPNLSFDDLSTDPEGQQIAARLSGDPDKIEAALDKLRAHLGADGAKLLSQRVGDDVVVSANADYLKDLAKSGSLGDSDLFRAVVPDADGATTVSFVNFDADDWLAKQSSGSDRADVEPLKALGMSVTKEDGQQHIVFRLSFD